MNRDPPPIYLIHAADLNGVPEGQCCCHDGVTATREGTGRTVAIVILVSLYCLLYI